MESNGQYEEFMKWFNETAGERARQSDIFLKGAIKDADNYLAKIIAKRQVSQIALKHNDRI